MYPSGSQSNQVLSFCSHHTSFIYSRYVDFVTIFVTLTFSHACYCVFDAGCVFFFETKTDVKENRGVFIRVD